MSVQFFFFKQKTAYEMRISDWSSDVCSYDLAAEAALSSRWFSFTEPDFLACDTANPIVIEATVGELSKSLKSDERLGLYIRGWTAVGQLREDRKSVV